MFESFDVVITTHAIAPDALWETVESCLTQTVSPQRIFLINNGSPHLYTLPTPYAHLPHLLYVQHIHPQSLATVRNKAAQLSAADYILFLEAGTILHATWVEQMLAFSRQHPYAGALAGRILPQYPKNASNRWLLRQLTTPGERASKSTDITHAYQTLFIKRKRFERIGGFSAQHTSHPNALLASRLREEGYTTLLNEKALGCLLHEPTSAGLAQRMLYHRAQCTGNFDLLSKLSLYKLLQEAPFIAVRILKHILRAQTQMAFIETRVAFWQLNQYVHHLVARKPVLSSGHFQAA